MFGRPFLGFGALAMIRYYAETTICCAAWRLSSTWECLYARPEREHMGSPFRSHNNESSLVHRTPLVELLRAYSHSKHHILGPKAEP